MPSSEVASTFGNESAIIGVEAPESQGAGRAACQGQVTVEQKFRFRRDRRIVRAPSRLHTGRLPCNPSIPTSGEN
jgi:hypothetical protein